MNCGTSLTANSSGNKDGANPEDKSLEKFIPPELMTKFEAARAQDAMMGERRVITMLFCDVKGSTSAAEKVDPETWTDIMNGIFGYMIRPVYKYEGTVPRLMGDAILAFFGAPIAHEDDPQRAVLAGLEIQEGIKDYIEEIRLKHGLEFALRVGINTGLVVVGAIGSDLRMEYTAIGDAINLAARMEQTAVPGTVQISEDTYKLVSPFFDFEALGHVEVKGKAEPIKTFRPLGVKETPGQLRGLEGLTSPLVGRDEQLALLKARLKNLAEGTGSVVAVVGEAGLGKSTLVAELKKSDSSFTWLRGDSLSYTRSISYYPWRQMIRQSVDAHDDDSPAEVRHKLGYVCECCTLPGGDIPFLEAMLAVESEESSKVVMGFQGDALNQRMIEATRGFMCGLAAESPLVIIFDDLHWADQASLNLMLNVLDLSSVQPIVFICMARPDITAPSWNVLQKMKHELAEMFHSIQLEPLQADQTDILLNNLLDVNILPKSIRALIAEKGQGNPFFIEEMIRSLIETKQIVHEGGQWKAVGDETKISLPNTLLGVLSARVDRLPESSKHVLQNASVIGRLFDLRILKRLTGLNGGLDPHIQFLSEVSLIEALREEYAFRHVLIQEATYESILIKKRAELHKVIGETMESLQTERIEEFAPLLAYHFYTAGDDRSLKYDIIAGEKSARLYANAEAATHFGRALEVAKRIKSEVETFKHICNQLGQALELSGRYQEALATYDELHQFGREHGERSVEMFALMAKATIYSIFTELHDSALSAELLTEALEISKEIGDRNTQAKLNWNLMITYLFSRRLDESLQHGEIALTFARESDDLTQLAFVLNDLCRLYTCRGDFDKAHTAILEARGLWETLENRVMYADSLGSEAEAFFNEGKFNQGLEYSEKALHVSEETNNLWGQAYDSMLMSFVYFELGELGRGIQVAEQSVQFADQAGLIASSISLRAELGLVYAYCGNFEKSVSTIDAAIQFAESKQPAWKSFPLAAKARMYLLQDDIQSTQRIIGNTPLQPTTIPYARYTIFVCIANIELAVTIREFKKALLMIDELMAEVEFQTKVDLPEVLRWKGKALFGLNRVDEALPALTEACSLAKQLGANPQLWPILGDLAEVNQKLERHEEAKKNKEEARAIIQKNAESLRELGLSDLFLNQPRVQKLIRD